MLGMVTELLGQRIYLQEKLSMILMLDLGVVVMLEGLGVL